MKLSMPGAVIIAGLIIALAVLYGTGAFTGQSGGSQGANNKPKPAALVAPHAATAANLINIDASVAEDGHAFIGSPDAPVTLTYWFDYQCPFCAAVEGAGGKDVIDYIKKNDPNWTPVIPELTERYVKPGQLKIVFKMFPFLGPDSMTLAVAAQAVIEAAPKQFFLWQQTIFANHGDENSGWGTKDRVLEMTKFVPGIDAAKVSQLMTEKAEAYQKIAQADRAEAQKLGIKGTPGFALGSEVMAGARSASVFFPIIDAALAKKK